MQANRSSRLEVREMLAAMVDDPNGAARWAAPFGTDIHAAWADCPRGGWLLRIASLAGASERAYSHAGVLVASAALDLVPGARAIIASDLAAILASFTGPARARDGSTPWANVVDASHRDRGLQGDRPSPERDERGRRTLALKALVRAKGGMNVWPTAADMARAVARATPGVDLDAFDRECVIRIRSVIPIQSLSRHLERPPTAPAPQPCYVEVRFATRATWEAIARVWALAVDMKRRNALDAKAGVWAGIAGSADENTLRDAIYMLSNGEYELLDAVLTGPSTGKLRFEPLAFPYGGIAGMCALAEAFGCEVVANDDGTGPRRGGL